MKKNLLSMVLFFCVSLFAFVGCSDDDDDNDGGGASSAVMLDGVKGKVYDAGFQAWPQGTAAEWEPHVNLMMWLTTADANYHVEMTIMNTGNPTNLREGQNLFDELCIDEFQDMAFIYDGSSYEPESGKVVLKKIEKGYYVISFEKFTFIEEGDRSTKTHVLNGTIKFEDYGN